MAQTYCQLTHIRYRLYTLVYIDMYGHTVQLYGVYIYCAMLLLCVYSRQWLSRLSSSSLVPGRLAAVALRLYYISQCLHTTASSSFPFLYIFLHVVFRLLLSYSFFYYFLSYIFRFLYSCFCSPLSLYTLLSLYFSFALCFLILLVLPRILFLQFLSAAVSSFSCVRVCLWVCHSIWSKSSGPQARHRLIRQAGQASRERARERAKFSQATRTKGGV